MLKYFSKKKIKNFYITYIYTWDNEIKEKGISMSHINIVDLGQTGIKIPILGMGTGTGCGLVQREMGQKKFNYLVRYAYDHGIRFIDTAQIYNIHDMIKKAIKGIPREHLFIQTKIPWRDCDNISRKIDQYRQELSVDYIDSILIHCVKSRQWPSELKKIRDQLSNEKQNQHILLHGASIHGLPALESASECSWSEINLCRMNPMGKHVDGAEGKRDEPSNVPLALKFIKKIHNSGRGVVCMKIIGEGDFKESDQREKSIQFIIKYEYVDAIVVGFKNISEIDDVINRVKRALSI